MTDEERDNQENEIDAQELHENGGSLTAVYDDSDTSDETASNEEDATQEATEDANAEPVDELPEKLKGKSVEEVADMYLNIERLNGKNASLVGQQRQMIDEYILKSVSNSTEVSNAEPKEDLSSMLYEDPEKFIEKVTSKAKEEATKEALSAIPVAMGQASDMQDLTTSYPDFTDTVGSVEFGVFLQGVPMAIKTKADSDPKTLKFLLDSFGGVNVAQEQQAQEVAQENQNQRRRTATQAANGVSATNKAKSSHSFTNVELALMMKENPDEYRARQPEILKAYKEGRVKEV